MQFRIIHTIEVERILNGKGLFSPSATIDISIVSVKKSIVLLCWFVLLRRHIHPDPDQLIRSYFVIISLIARD